MKTRTPRKAKSTNLETEVKLKVRDLDKLRNKIQLLGFEELVSKAFEDNWVFDFSDKRLFSSGQLLRVREFEGKILLTFKGPRTPSRHFKIHEELETSAGERTVLHAILERLGLSVSFRYQKYRSVFERRSAQGREKVTLVLDETPIGAYMEIEGSRKSIDLLASRLGFRREDFITESYISLFLKGKQAGWKWFFLKVKEFYSSRHFFMACITRSLLVTGSLSESESLKEWNPGWQAACLTGVETQIGKQEKDYEIKEDRNSFDTGNSALSWSGFRDTG